MGDNADRNKRRHSNDNEEECTSEEAPSNGKEKDFSKCLPIARRRKIDESNSQVNGNGLNSNRNHSSASQVFQVSIPIKITYLLRDAI